MEPAMLGFTNLPQRIVLTRLGTIPVPRLPFDLPYSKNMFRPTNPLSSYSGRPPGVEAPGLVPVPVRVPVWGSRFRLAPLRGSSRKTQCPVSGLFRLKFRFELFRRVFLLLQLDNPQFD